MSTYYHKPGAFARAFNRLFTWLFARGMGGKHNVTIEVKGRKSGQPRRTAVNIVEYKGQRYLVAPRGNTEWTRNVKAAGGEAALVHGKPEPVMLVDVPVPERPPIIQTYLQENAMSTKASFGIDPKSPIEEFERIADRHPVFRITPR
jgi:deazaflavin-dependent oxidoreductase (nitroreductase family)